jgi:hypothetical protein
MSVCEITVKKRTRCLLACEIQNICVFAFSETTTRAPHKISRGMSSGQKSIASFFGGGAAKANAPAVKRVADDAAKGALFLAALPGSGCAFPPIAILAAVDLGIRTTNRFRSPSPVPDRFPPSSPRAHGRVPRSNRERPARREEAQAEA